MLEDLERIATQIARGVSVPSSKWRVVTHASFSLHGLTPLLKQYLATFDQVRLALTLLHRPVDLIEEGFDEGIVALRQVNGSTLIDRPLVTVAPVAVASPADLGTHRAPLHPDDLVRHTLLAPSADVHGYEGTSRPPTARACRC
ncbi:MULTISPECIES: LysR substrate-binding domain-containing protein [unclassified Paraburkholderia]|uniref:LysR substrate-binding domain-containing protein n=1 Tax=unclassified Paraburkholderia TaxID=2615204 RepID=UPI002AB20086|nr:MULTISPECIES: LysR substrate-binding domain-containing protein [unclassified Paraburkholderia]